MACPLFKGKEHIQTIIAGYIRQPAWPYHASSLTQSEIGGFALPELKSQIMHTTFNSPHDLYQGRHLVLQ